MTKTQFESQMLKVTNNFKKYGGEVHIDFDKEVKFKCKRDVCHVSICDDTDIHVVYEHTLDLLIPLKQIIGFGVNKDRSLFFYVGKDIDNQIMINIS